MIVRMWAPQSRPAQFALARPGAGGRGVGSFQLRPTFSMARHAWPLVVVADADPPHPAGWRSLDRRSPFSDVRCRRSGTVERIHTAHRLACGIQPPAHADDRVPGIHPRDQDRASVTRVRGERCRDPERLPSCPGSADFHRGSTLPSKVVHARIEASRTRSPGLLRDASSKAASAHTRLDRPPPDLATERRAPRDASDRLLQPTFQRRAPA